MALTAPVKALSLVVFLAAIAGATYAVSTYVGDTVESQLVTATSPHARLNVTPGHNVSFVVDVHNRDIASRDLAIEVVGLVSGSSEVTTVRGNTSVGIFVQVNVPEGAVVGEHALDVKITSEGRTLRERPGLLTINILPVVPGFAFGDRGEAVYTGRLSATGRVFNTNDAALIGVAVPKTDSYRYSEGLLPIQTAPRPNVVQGLYEGMLGMQPGESRTISFPPAKGYGPATNEEIEPREEAVLRDLTIVNDAQRVPRATFDTYVAESRQGRPENFTNGSIFILNQNGNDWPYKIVNMTPEIVEYKLAANIGQSYTVYPFWANGSVIVDINDSAIIFRTTPTTEPGAVFTMKQYWPQMTTLVSVNETAAIVRHTPPVGYTYTTLSQLGQPREATVKEVGANRIIVGLPATNPLAGKDLTFDITLVSLTKQPS